MANVEMAESYLTRSRAKLDEARRQLKSVRYAESVSASQESIELAVKGLFLACDVSFKKSHDIKELDFAKVLPNIPDNAAKTHNFPRVLLLAWFWSGFYLTAKYGHEELRVGADKLFKKDEAELAVAHAQECQYACDHAFRQIRLEGEGDYPARS